MAAGREDFNESPEPVYADMCASLAPAVCLARTEAPLICDVPENSPLLLSSPRLWETWGAHIPSEEPPVFIQKGTGRSFCTVDE